MKAARNARKVILLQAQIASARGEHALARELFASVGIGYHHTIIN